MLVLLLPASAQADRLHPQDGPHVDVRILIEDSGVTFNLMINLVFVDEIVTAPREDPDMLHEVEVPALRAALSEFFAAENTVQIDGVEVTPVLTAFENMEPDISLLPLFPISGVRGISKVRMSLNYPAKSPPETVAMKWGPYPIDILLSEPGNVQRLEIVAEMTAEGLKSNIVFTEQEPEYTWHATGETIEDRFLAVPDPHEPSFWHVPVLSLALVLGLGIFMVGARASRGWATIRKPVMLIVTPLVAIAAVLTHDIATVAMPDPLDDSGDLPSSDQALAIFKPLHANIYRAFDYTEESDIYDALARSVHGPLLDDLYNQIYRSLILYEEGGAVSRVEEVTQITEEVGAIGQIDEYNDAIGFHLTARWEVLGTVYHWGHSHSRLNQYLAEYTVIDTEDGWRIAGNRILEQQRINLDEPPPTPPIDFEI